MQAAGEFRVISERLEAGSGAKPMTAMDRALAQIAALGDTYPTREELLAKRKAQWESGLRPRYGIWGERLPVDEAAERARIESDLRKATWDTPVGEVIAAQLGEAA